MRRVPARKMAAPEAAMAVVAVRVVEADRAVAEAATAAVVVVVVVATAADRGVAGADRGATDEKHHHF